MGSSWTKFRSECKSRLSALARSCFLRRRYWFGRFQKLKLRFRELRAQANQLRERSDELEREVRFLRQRIGDLEALLSQSQPVKLPVGEPVRGLQYGVGLIVLCVNLARAVGLRPAVCAVEIFFAWLGVRERVPTYQTVRGWMQRVGLYRLQNARRIDGGVWLTDHSNQIGKEKVFVVLRVSESHPGTPVRHDEVEFLALVPGEHWKREDVAQAYRQTADRFGVPRAIASDGAVELREPVELLGTPEHRPLSLRDPKHFFANQLESLLKRDPQWEAFTKHVGGLRPALQQTELAHFVPRGFKSKARFMNLEPTLAWASAVLWHLNHPESTSCQGITRTRLTDKLGWLRDFTTSIDQWTECQAVISAGLAFLNQQGLFPGVADRFWEYVAPLSHSPMSRELVQKAIQYLRDRETKLRSGERLTMSTEIVESAFALYKQLERQHSQSGFTSLLLTFPILLKETTPQEVTAALARVKVADVNRWSQEHVPRTLAAKRRRMFREARTARKNSATKKPVAA